jgi:hypothetical protein
MILKRRFLKNLIFILGFTSTLTSFYLTILNPLTDASFTTKINSLIIFMLLNILIAAIRSLPKSNVHLEITNRVNLSVFYGNIFKQKDVIVIPVNEYFDTIVDEEIVSSSTLHGQFVKNVFGGNIEVLEQKISKELQNHKVVSLDQSRIRGNKQKYKLGTTISINKNGVDYFLVAFTRFSTDNKAESFNIDYQVVIQSLLDYIHLNSQGRNINIPLIGGGLSGVNISKQKLLEYLLLSIQIHDHLTISGNVNVVLNKNLKNDKIDLCRIEEVYS